MEAHTLTARMERDLPFPFLVLLASGGHCMLLYAHALGDYALLGATRDDAPGEAFDKIARAIGVAGGPEIEALAKRVWHGLRMWRLMMMIMMMRLLQGDSRRFSFPVALSQQRR